EPGRDETPARSDFRAKPVQDAAAEPVQDVTASGAADRYLAQAQAAALSVVRKSSNPEPVGLRGMVSLVIRIKLRPSNRFESSASRTRGAATLSRSRTR